jgi:hypothetical protein
MRLAELALLLKQAENVGAPISIKKTSTQPPNRAFLFSTKVPLRALTKFRLKTWCAAWEGDRYYDQSFRY